MLHYWDEDWQLRPDDCPCDVHFVEFLEHHRITDAAIFHFGTGGHHYVGIRMAENGSNNVVLGVTASPREYEDYIRLAIERPEISRSYKVEFGDIYLTEKRLLPMFDVVSLFHLCEFRTEKNDEYGALNDLELTLLLLDRMPVGGWMLFFPKSYAWESARLVVDELERRGHLTPAGDCGTLLLYRKADAAGAAG